MMSPSLSNLDPMLQDCFGNWLPDEIIQKLGRSLERQTPAVGERFWQSEASSGQADAQAGLWLVLRGKVRLLNEQNELFLTLNAGESFGEGSLFKASSDDPAQPTSFSHSARASTETELAYLPVQQLHPLLQRFPDWETALCHQALSRQLLQLVVQHPDVEMGQRGDRKASPELILQHCQQLTPQMLPQRARLPQLPNCPFFVLHSGELRHESGITLLPQQGYSSDQLPSSGEWRVTQSSALYAFTPGQWSDLQRGLAPRQKGDPPDISERTPPVQNPARSRKRRSWRSKVDRPRSASQASSANSQRLGEAYFPNPQVKAKQFWQRSRNQYPFIAQQSNADCGITCLAMVGQYWGKNFDLNHLRSIANVDRSGTSLKGLMNAAESLGFTTRPIQSSFEQLQNQPLPAIAHWAGKHYVVVYRITRSQVFISDPEIGRLRLSHAEFQAGWVGGYLLVLQPTPFLGQAPEAQRNLMRFVPLLKPHLPVLLEIIFASLTVQVFGLVIPLFTQILLDRVITQRSTSTFMAISAGLLIFSLFSLVMRTLRRYLLYHTANKIDVTLITGFINHTLRLPLGFFETRYVGDITSRIQENQKIRSFLTSEAITTLLDVLTLFVYMGLMLWYSWQMTVVALAPLPLFLLLTLTTTPYLRRISREVFTAKTTESSYLIELLNGVRTVKSMGLERQVRWQWEGLFHQFIRKKFSGRMVRLRISFVSRLIESISSTGLLVLGVWLVLQQRLSIGQLFAFNMLVGNVVGPSQRLISLWNDFQEILIAIERLNDVIDTPPEEDITLKPRQQLPQLKGHIRLEEVCFRYDIHSDRNILTNINLDIQPGQTIALVGRSGSGKSTLAKLALGLYLPTSGRLLIDGYNITSVSLESLRQQIGVVDQNTFLFGGSIKDNIALGSHDADLEQIRRAAHQAGAAEFIEALPMQYDTQIGEGGGMLSGGQRQRLAIARALLGNPRILILDEATSSLDAESERIIQNNLNDILRRQTTLIIAHRLSTVRNADLILVLDDGIVVERGNHQELMEKRGQYYYLNQQQFTKE